MKKLKKMREKCGLSKRAVADEMGVDIKTIYNWEHGRTEPSRADFLMLSQIYCKGTEDTKCTQ